VLPLHHPPTEWFDEGGIILALAKKIQAIFFFGLYRVPSTAARSYRKADWISEAMAANAAEGSEAWVIGRPITR